MIVAGHETTGNAQLKFLRRFGSDSCKIATALSWLIYHLCKHPEVQEKVKNEILTKIGKNVPVTQDATKEVSLNDSKEQNINLIITVALFIASSQRKSAHPASCGTFANETSGSRLRI
jgi:septum formation topological specificity factor MinE